MVPQGSLAGHEVSPPCAWLTSLSLLSPNPLLLHLRLHLWPRKAQLNPQPLNPRPLSLQPLSLQPQPLNLPALRSTLTPLAAQ